MSQENVELVRAIYASWDRGEPLFDPGKIREDVEFVNPHDAIDRGTRHGLHGFAAAGQAVVDAFGTLSHEVETLRDADPYVIASVTFNAQGAASGIAVEQSEFHVSTFRDGKVSRFAWFRSMREALEAAELQE
jgi:ketosteroid isomerase-like protein